MGLLFLDCRETFNTTTGNVTSRGYPHGYPESDCIYVITPPNTTHHIYKLSINDLEIKSTGDSLHVSPPECSLFKKFIKKADTGE